MTDLQRVQDESGQHLAAIQQLFKPGAKLTLLVRTPSYPDGSRDLVLTSDSIDAAIAALQVRAAADAARRG